MIAGITPKATIFTLFLLILGALGGGLAAMLGAPMPFMLGALAISGAMAGLFGQHFPKKYSFPSPLRLLFIGVIGIMIGAQVDASLLAQARGIVLSFVAVSLFVVLAQLINTAIFQRIGGYDRTTAWFSASPGGLLEAITMGENAGGNVQVITLLHFMRIILVVTVLPILMSIWHGAPVGSASGMSLGQAQAGQGGPQVVLWIVALTLAGLLVGQKLRLPAWQLTGPLIAAALVSLFGWVDIYVPAWLLASAQIVLGVSLGVRFYGVGRAMLMKAVNMSILSVSFMLALGVALALVVAPVTGLALDVLIVSYAPGGVSEMGLIAVSLAANPALVAIHHLYRITLTVLLLSMARRFGVLQP